MGLCTRIIPRRASLGTIRVLRRKTSIMGQEEKDMENENKTNISAGQRTDKMDKGTKWLLTYCVAILIIDIVVTVCGVLSCCTTAGTTINPPNTIYLGENVKETNGVVIQWDSLKAGDETRFYTDTATSFNVADVVIVHNTYANNYCEVEVTNVINEYWYDCEFISLYSKE